MRARVRGLTVAALAVGGLLAGCVPATAGTDGDLLDQWNSLPEPEVFVPEAGTCHAVYRSTVKLAMYNPIRCDFVHETETAYVGEFTGEVAGRNSPPSPGTEIWRTTYRECDEVAADYLGDNFRYAQGLRLAVAVPSAEAWGGGARWFRCDLVTPLDPDWSELRRSSLAEALTDVFPLRMNCTEVTDLEDDSVNLQPTDCDEPHQAELVGLLEVDHPRYPEELTGRMFDDCFQLALDYIGIGVSDLRVPTYSILSRPTEEDWDNGNRTLLCHFAFDDDEVIGSLEGVGASGLRRALR